MASGHDSSMVKKAEATSAEIAKAHKEHLDAYYDGKKSKAFIAGVKEQMMFKCDWSGLLSAAPTAISMMGACWAAVSQEGAERITIHEFAPKPKGFKYLTNYTELNLRGALVDVCEKGGYRAFTAAASNMETLRTRSNRLLEEGGEIDIVFQRLPPCLKDEDHLEDFLEALRTVSENAGSCADTAKETKDVFDNWACMVGELHAVCEVKFGSTSRSAEEARHNLENATFAEAFARTQVDEAQEQVEEAKRRLDRADARLDKAIDKLPGPWESLAMTVANTFAQAAPSILGAALPMMMASASPAMAAGVAMGSLSQGLNNANHNSANNGNNNTNNNNNNAGNTNGTANGTHSADGKNDTRLPAQVTLDPACHDAQELLPILQHFYAYLGGEAGKIDWTKFDEPKSSVTPEPDTAADGASTTVPDNSNGTDTKDPAENTLRTESLANQPDAGTASSSNGATADTATQSHGVTWLLGELTDRQNRFQFTTTGPSLTLKNAYTSAIEVSQEIQVEVQNRSKTTEPTDVTPAVLAAWKTKVKTASDNAWTLNSMLLSHSSVNAPNPFTQVKVNIPPTDYSAQVAQVSASMQHVQLMQSGAEAAESKYEEAIRHRRETKKAQVNLQNEIRQLKESGKTLQSIMKVLRDCIAVLVDINMEVAKLESFFTALQLFITNLVMPEAKSLTKMLEKSGRRARAKGYLYTEDTARDRIYIVTLQTKAYFSLLHDIADMYVDVNLKYIEQGMKLCSDLSKYAAAGSIPIEALDKLDHYASETTKAIHELVEKKEKDLLDGLGKRVKAIQAGVKSIEDVGTENQLNNAADRKALTDGHEMVKDDAKAVLKHEKPAVTERRPPNPKDEMVLGDQ